MSLAKPAFEIESKRIKNNLITSGMVMLVSRKKDQPVGSA